MTLEADLGPFSQPSGIAQLGTRPEVIGSGLGRPRRAPSGGSAEALAKGGPRARGALASLSQPVQLRHGVVCGGKNFFSQDRLQ
ncbi:hypothetical protein DHEL01_v210963 [Diaporthe helianthi]|uniref:Uncharacterized protein n=1 Tax=Diaporthe helianthi TaxID=158607 RepID=A0A2P5HK56_DIAHE|nr:hypothetical protein DHEL01_v210963 [Diaporthe helianthi]